MTRLVPEEDIERIVGVTRGGKHMAHAVSTEQTVYILHSQKCKERTEDLRDCPYSRALDRGIDEEDWEGYLDRPVPVGVNFKGLLVPNPWQIPEDLLD